MIILITCHICGMSRPSGQEHQTQTLVFLFYRVWVQSVGLTASRDTCVVKQDT